MLTDTTKQGRYRLRSKAESVKPDLQRVAMHPKAIIVCDDAACGELKVDTYRYFKDIEGANLDVEKLLR